MRALGQRAASKGELRRFVQRCGTEALLDRESKRFLALGLRQAHYDDARWLELLAEEPGILRTPLARFGSQFAIGHAPEAWASWV